jgi:hypothetical protein
MSGFVVDTNIGYLSIALLAFFLIYVIIRLLTHRHE